MNKKPYICEDTIVQIRKTNRIGRVIGFNKELNVVVIKGETSFWTTYPEALNVISYREVNY